MNETEIKTALTRLAELRQEQAAIKAHFDLLRSSIIPADILSALADIDAEEQTAQEAASAGIEQLTTNIKASVANLGASVKSGSISAIYSAGRVTWDTKALDGYAAAHPEIVPFRKVGEPSVSIREVTK